MRTQRSGDLLPPKCTGSSLRLSSHRPMCLYPREHPSRGSSVRRSAATDWRYTRPSHAQASNSMSTGTFVTGGQMKPLNSQQSAVSAWLGCSSGATPALSAAVRCWWRRGLSFMDEHSCQATALSTLRAPSHLALTTTLGGRYSYLVKDRGA